MLRPTQITGPPNPKTSPSFKFQRRDVRAYYILVGHVIRPASDTVIFLLEFLKGQLKIIGAFNLQPLFQKRVEKWFQKSGFANSDFFFWSTTFLQPEKRWIYGIKPSFFWSTTFLEPEKKVVYSIILKKNCRNTLNFFS